MVNSTSADIQMKLEGVISFKNLGATIIKDVTRIKIATAAMVRLSRLLTSSSSSFLTKCRLYKSFVVSILLYNCGIMIASRVHRARDKST
ncbi:hypothetical protein DPMN_080278 [Dreissena polymorpha]|uniref:Uncharacterized protein n=1 Tax=Dreissena polymorpha TaxID=45954 RepID=A0A9D4BTQ0_DREPO|nr:hypothetical protein DPMN_080278 [Dreissena polymorpha]